MINKIRAYLRDFKAIQRINLGLSRGVANLSQRKIDPSHPSSWEFSAFSQNGEDGIIDYLIQKLNNQSRYFVEIGSSDGIENNTAWLAISKKNNGLMIEGDREKFNKLTSLMTSMNLGVECINQYVTVDNLQKIVKACITNKPDVLSLDIDGMDYYILKALLEFGLRPKIAVVEYNSVFGPIESLTIPHSDSFDYLQAHPSGLYYGVSIIAWKRLFESYNYQFVTVDQNGVNAFFIDRDEYDKNFYQEIKGLSYRENFYQLRKFKTTWGNQFKIIKHMDFMLNPEVKTKI